MPIEISSHIVLFIEYLVINKDNVALICAIGHAQVVNATRMVASKRYVPDQKFNDGAAVIKAISSDIGGSYSQLKLW
jgi:hypothetical protein